MRDQKPIRRNKRQGGVANRSRHVPTRTGQRLLPRQQEAKLRGLAAISRVRRGKSKTLSSAARAERTSLKTIRELLPSALRQNRPGGRIRVKAGDPYSAPVEIMTDLGPLVAIARGSRQRELAGRHRATYMRVLAGKESATALEQFRGKTVGSHELISDYELLSSFAQAGVVGQLDSLYVSPDASV